MKAPLKYIPASLLVLIAFAVGANITLVPVASADNTAISSCGTVITLPGNYHITQDLNCPTGTAIEIQANDVKLHFDGHTLDGSGTGFIGVDSLGLNVTIFGSGSTVIGFSAAVDIEGDNSRVLDLTATQNGQGIHLASNNDTVVSCTITNNTGEGILLNGSNNSTVTSNISSNNTQSGIFIDGLFVPSSNNIVRANQTDGNSLGIAIRTGGTANLTEANKAHNNISFDLTDLNPGCDSNTWKNNQFGTADQSCIN